MFDNAKLKKICQLLRYDILTSTTVAGSGHPTSCLSAVELMATLFFGGFLNRDDRVIFSKGHAAPLLYSLYHAAGLITYQELLTLRKFNSNLEGHPGPRFPYVEVATGSLGQGLSVGLGMALGIKLKIKNLKLKISYEPKVWVLLGDSESAEGQIWEAAEIASHYNLNNLIAILDVNRLGQANPTMLGWDLSAYQKRFEAFGWKTILLEDGHNLDQGREAFQKVNSDDNKKPTIIIAKTIKGKGISFLEDKEGWHGKALPNDKLKIALKEIGEVDKKFLTSTTGPVSNSSPPSARIRQTEKILRAVGALSSRHPSYKLGDFVSTRQAYGNALIELGELIPNLVVFDAEVGNSTFEEKFKAKFTDRFFQMFITEQNMLSAALGISKMGYIPFVATFAAFLTRSFDQIRMAQYSNANLKIAGSHAGVSIGQDGPSQMGLEDIAMLRSVQNSVILYPSDAVSANKLCSLMVNGSGLFYLRLTRAETPVIYKEEEKFEVGGSKVLFQSEKDVAVVFSAGITLHEAIKAKQELLKENIQIAVVDLYCLKPLDAETIKKLAIKTKNLIVVEDHYQYGGIAEAVSAIISNFQFPISNFIHLCVKKTPISGSPQELLEYEEIDYKAIMKSVKKIISQ